MAPCLRLQSADPEAPTGDEILSEDEVLEADMPLPSGGQPPLLLRPGVVHRLDKGTTGAHSPCCGSLLDLLNSGRLGRMHLAVLLMHSSLCRYLS